MTRDEYVSLIKTNFVNLAVKKAMSLIVSKVPFLKWPFFNPLTSLFVGWILREAIEDAEAGVFFWYIDMRVDSQGRAYSDAVAKLEAAKLTGNSKEIANAEAHLKLAFTNLVRLST